MRTVLAFVVAPLMVPVVVFLSALSFGLLPFIPPDPSLSMQVLTALQLAVISLIPAYAVALLGGIPTHRRLRRGDVSLRSYAAAGAALGGGPFLVWGLSIYVLDPTTRDLPLRVLLPVVVVGAVAGICSATAFWTIAIHSSQRNLEDQGR